MRSAIVKISEGSGTRSIPKQALFRTIRAHPPNSWLHESGTKKGGFYAGLSTGPWLGDQVGWARADVSEDGISELRHGITPLWEMADTIDARGDEYDVFVIEDWRLYATHAKTMIGSTFPSVQFIGAVKLVARRYGVKVVMQGASIKRVADARLKVDRPDIYDLVTREVAHKDGHDQDALRHLFYYAFKRNLRSKV